jgi:hypothetical protein
MQKESRMKVLTARSSFGDWRGEAKAGSAIHDSLSTYLEKQGEIEENDIVVAVDADILEAGGEPAALCYVHAYVMSGYKDGDAARLALESDSFVPHLKEISFELPVLEFLGFFKELNVVIASKSFEILNRNVSVIELSD